MEKKLIKAVIFDIDGLFIHTEPFGDSRIERYWQSWVMKLVKKMYALLRACERQTSQWQLHHLLLVGSLTSDFNKSREDIHWVDINAL